MISYIYIGFYKQGDVMEISKEFQDFLENTPTALKQFLDIISEFRKIQLQPPQHVADATGPKKWKFNEDHPLLTEGISLEDIEAIEKGYAEATVKEKAIEYVKGFISGVMLAAG